MEDRVNHPSHYTQGKIEVIDFIEDQKLDFHLANAVKYICRAGKKDPMLEVEDLKKAIWYIQRYIDHVAEPNLEAAKAKAREEIVNGIAKAFKYMKDTIST